MRPAFLRASYKYYTMLVTSSTFFHDDETNVSALKGGVLTVVSVKYTFGKGAVQ